LVERRRIISANDLLITAQALTFGYTIFTDNYREFSRIDSLTLENWLRSP
jgi:tRNA(fMet)-specific endonuclease VapC